jgi:hypothetical protein
VSTSDDDGERGFQAPPGAASAGLEWSDWLPRTRPGTTPHNRLTYRSRASTSHAHRVIGDWRWNGREQLLPAEVNGGNHRRHGDIHPCDSGRDVPSIWRPTRRNGSPTWRCWPGRRRRSRAHVNRQDNTGRSFFVSADSGQLRVAEIGELYRRGSGQEPRRTPRGSARSASARGLRGRIDRPRTITPAST